MAEEESQLPVPTQAEFHRFLEIQEAEIKARTQELALRGKEIDANARNAEKSIEAQLEVEKLRQQAFLKQDTSRSWLLGSIIAGAITIILASLWLEKESVAIELLKQAAIVVGSFAGGYAVAKRKQDS